MFKKVYSQNEFISDYIPSLTKADFDKNEAKIDQEIKKIEKNYPSYKQVAVNVTFNNKKQNLEEFLKLLKQQKANLLEKKNIKKVYDTSLFHNIGGKNVDVSTEESREGLKRDIAALQKQIQEREEELAQIDNFIVSLLTGESATLNIGHTNAKFIKIAEDNIKEADERLEDYINEEMNYAPYGTALEHPEENRNKLTEDIKKHSSSHPVPKFKKK